MEFNAHFQNAFIQQLYKRKLQIEQIFMLWMCGLTRKAETKGIQYENILLKDSDQTHYDAYCDLEQFHLLQRIFDDFIFVLISHVIPGTPLYS